MATTVTDIGAKNKKAFHTSRATKIAVHNQRGKRILPAGWLGPGGFGSFRGCEGGVGVLAGPLTRSSVLVGTGGCDGQAARRRVLRWGRGL